MTFLRTCPRCKQPKDEEGFKKPGGWCADCRSIYHNRLKELNERRTAKKRVEAADPFAPVRVRVQAAKMVELRDAPALPSLDLSASRERCMNILKLCLQVGEAKGKAMTLGRNSSHGKRAWGVYYWLRKKLDEMLAKENGE